MLINNENKLIYIIVLTVCLMVRTVIAQSKPINEQQQIHQEQQQKAREQQLSPQTPDVRFQVKTEKSDLSKFPVESPCFLVNKIVIHNLRAVPLWLRLQSIANKGVNRCLGGRGIKQLIHVLQNRLIEHGYITSRIQISEQDLTSGVLELELVAGKVNHIQLSQNSSNYLTLLNSVPISQGDLLNLRDLEQGLENLQRIPTAQADIAISPADKEGESDIKVSWQQTRFWRLLASFDDSGTKSTGKYQGGLTFYLDNPTSLSDMFYISGGHDIKGRNEKGSNNFTANYTIPLGYFFLSAALSGYKYNETIAGNIVNYQYKGRIRNQALRLSRILYRDSAIKGSVFYEIGHRSSQNYINDYEIGVQRRDTTFWKLGLTYRHYFEHFTFDSRLDYQRGTRWFGAQPAQEEFINDATALSKIIHFSSAVSVPFSLFGQSFNYYGQYQRQMAKTPLTSQERFAIGSRWSVRGFDGELNLSADNGWTIRNDMTWFTPINKQQIYLGIDYGEVNGSHRSYDLAGKHLAGGVVGIKGGIPKINLVYDLFVGRSLSKPASFKTSRAATGFNLIWEY